METSSMVSSGLSLVCRVGFHTHTPQFFRHLRKITTPRLLHAKHFCAIKLNRASVRIADSRDAAHLSCTAVCRRWSRLVV